MIRIYGKGASKGITEGTLYFFRRSEPLIEKKYAPDSEAELARFEAARQLAMQQLSALYHKVLEQVSEGTAALFEAYRMMLEDDDYIQTVRENIFTGICAEAAVQETYRTFERRFSLIDNDYMNARIADIKDVSDRVLRILCGVQPKEIVMEEPVILAAEDLSPSELAQLDPNCILGVVTAGGEMYSHTAILARTMGVPAIVRAGKRLTDAHEGKYVMMDGQTGELAIEPDGLTTRRLKKKQAKERAMKELMDRLKGKPDVTVDGQIMHVYCNISSPDDLDAVVANDGAGIGLFRSEFLYLQERTFPTEEQQFRAYRAVAERMNGKRVIIRTADIGADKQVGYFRLDKEPNPAMGMRAIRIGLSRPEIFKTQLRALYRASAYGKIAILFPMIASLWEVQEVKRQCKAVQAELTAEGIPFNPDTELGIMLETPAAVLMSDQLAREVDFFSVGTNDLTQFTLAIDRQSYTLARFFDAHHPSVLRMIHLAAENAHRAGIWLGICGELAADISLTETFLALGVDELSVSPPSVLPLRSAIRSTTIGEKRDQILKSLWNPTA